MPPPPLPSISRKRKHYRDDQDRDVGSRSPVPESSASPSSHDAGDSEYDPTRGAGSSSRGIPGSGSRGKRAIQSKPSSGGPPSASATPTAATKVGPTGRPMSREQLRKANHSLIERRRREKINSALAELRAMVPGLCDDSGKGGEFKLEVLERTVEHMRELKQQIVDLESRVSHSRGGSRRRHDSESMTEDMDIDEPEYEQVSRHSHRHQSPASHKPSTTSTPPSPSMTPPSARHATMIMSPDPNETEAEADLPPPLTLASRHPNHSNSDNTTTDSSTHTASPHPPSIASLLASTTQPQAPRTMPAAPRSAPNPNIYLPFPTPSPTSPFLTYQGGSAASTASSATGPPEPSPFMAPLQNFSLFGGALDTPLDGPTKQHPSPPDLTMPAPHHSRDRADLAPEEAANLLLAFSSPDTLRPAKTGSTPLMSALSMPVSVSQSQGRERRLTLESEEFTLDGGVANYKHSSYSNGHHSHRNGPVPPRTQGKTARDILRM